MQIATSNDMKHLGALLGSRFQGGEMIELIGDVGAGKTTLTKGIGEGLKIDDDIQSPTFTISREYTARDGLQLHHYDFYRLAEAGVVGYELAESIANPLVITIVEWGGSAHEVLPEHRVVIRLNYTPDGEARSVEADVPDGLEYIAEILS